MTDSTTTYSTDPAIAAVEANRAAIKARAVFEQTCLTWLTTAPTTIEGVKATLEHASVPIDPPETMTVLIDASEDDNLRDATYAFPGMIAKALGHILEGTAPSPGAPATTPEP